MKKINNLYFEEIFNFKEIKEKKIPCCFSYLEDFYEMSKKRIEFLSKKEKKENRLYEMYKISWLFFVFVGIFTIAYSIFNFFKDLI